MTKPVLLVASPFEEDLLARVRERLPDWTVRYDAGLVPAPQYPGDHVGTTRVLDKDSLATWRAWLAEADAMLDFDWWQPRQMRVNCPRLRWVQSTSAGVGSYLDRYDVDLARIAITTAAGVHAAALAEFVLAGLLYHFRGLADLEVERQNQKWTRGRSATLAGRRAAVLGMGQVGTAVAATLEAVGVEVGRFDRRRMESLRPNNLGGELTGFDVVVLCLPSTPQTRDVLDRHVIAALDSHCIVVNVGRGDAIDESALVEALHEGSLGGAVLDVARTEPPPNGDPIWTAPRLVLSPHSAGNTAGENERILDIVVDNAQRLADGRELIHRYCPDRHY